jgi:CBS domain containing-hemolysin-like protein
MEPFILLLLLLLIAFFSGSETAFVTANRLRVEVVARRGDVMAPVVQDFLNDPARLLTTTLVGNNLALVIYSTLAAFYLDLPLRSLFTYALQPEEPILNILVLLTQTLLASVVVLVFGEILPKSILRETANRAVFALALPLRLAYFMLLPLITLASGASRALVRMAGLETDTFTQFMRRDFELMIEETQESGELDLDAEESELLSNVFALGSIRVKDSMVPRTDIAAVEKSISLEDLRQRFIETAHAKLPVYRDHIDQIVGVVFAYDLFRQPTSLDEILRPILFVPETKLSKDLLQEFLKTNAAIAIVLDEYGGTAGLVTLEDLLEELFGDIQDEYDTEEEVLRQVNEHTFVVSGRVDLERLAERFQLQLPTGDYGTVAGYLMDRTGSIPRPKEEFLLDGFRFTILQGTANRIDLVRIVQDEAG